MSKNQRSCGLRSPPTCSPSSLSSTSSAGTSPQPPRSRCPSAEDGWYVIPGELRDGQKVDLMPITRDDYSMHHITYEKPQDIPATYKNEHWRKYLENIYNQDHADQRLYFGQYIC